MTCKAKRVNDEMQCGQCGLTWGAGDEDRPECKVSVTVADGVASVKTLTNSKDLSVTAEVSNTSCGSVHLERMRDLLRVHRGDKLRARMTGDLYLALGNQTNSGEVLVSAANRRHPFYIAANMVEVVRE